MPQCVDCLGHFESKSNNAKRCPLCRKVRKTGYQRSLRGEYIKRPETYPDIEPLPEEELLALDDDEFLDEVYRMLGEGTYQGKQPEPRPDRGEQGKQIKQGKQLVCILCEGPLDRARQALYCSWCMRDIRARREAERRRAWKRAGSS